MTLNYDRISIRRRVDQVIRDEGNGTHSRAEKNRAIAEIHRDFVTRTECNRNIIIFSLASAVANGVLEYDRNAHTPTVTLVTVEDDSYYTVSGCDLITKLRIYDNNNVTWTELKPLNQMEVDAGGYLDTTSDEPEGYQVLDAPDTFRFLAPLASAGYPYKFELHYIESVADLITNDVCPTDTSTPVFSGAGLNDMTVSTGASTTYGTYVVTVGTAGTPDKHTYTKDGVSGGAAANMTATVVLGTGGPTVAFAATTGHTAGNTWTFYEDDYRTPSIPVKYRQCMLNGVLAYLWSIEGDSRADKYLMLYERDVERTHREVRRDFADRAHNIRSNYAGAGA